MAAERFGGCIGVLAWCDPQADLGAGNRDQLVDRLGDRWGVDGEHRAGRSGPHPLGERLPAPISRCRERPGLGPQFLLGQVERVHRISPRPAMATFPAVVVQGGQQAHSVVRASGKAPPNWPLWTPLPGSAPRPRSRPTRAASGHRRRPDPPVGRVGDDDTLGGERVPGRSRKTGRCSEPISSSPSTNTFTPIGATAVGADRTRGGPRFPPCRRQLPRP